MTSKAKRAIAETKEAIARVKQNAAKLEAELKKAVDQIVEKYEKGAEGLSVEEFKPKRRDVKVNLVALTWKPYWIVDYKEMGLLHRTAIEA